MVLPRVMMTMTKMLVIEGPRITKIPICSRFVSSFYALCLYSGPGERNLESHLERTSGRKHD